MKHFFLLILLMTVLQYWDSIKASFEPEPDPAQYSQFEVTLYGTANCPYCTKTRQLFARMGVPYTDYDIDADTQAHREFKRLGGVGVPLIVINDTVIRGYSKPHILRALGQE